MEDVRIQEISTDSGFGRMSVDSTDLAASIAGLKPVSNCIEALRASDVFVGDSSGNEGDRSEESIHEHASLAFHPGSQPKNSARLRVFHKTKPLGSLDDYFNQRPKSSSSDSGDSVRSCQSAESSKPRSQPKRAVRRSRKPGSNDKSQMKMDSFVREVKRAPVPKMFPAKDASLELDDNFQLNPILFKSPSTAYAPRKLKTSPAKIAPSTRDPTRPSPRRSLELDSDNHTREAQHGVCNNISVRDPLMETTVPRSYCPDLPNLSRGFRKKIHGAGTALRQSCSSTSLRNGPFKFQRKQRTKFGGKRLIASLANSSGVTVSSVDSHDERDEQPRKKKHKALHMWASSLDEGLDLLSAPLNGSISNPCLTQPSIPIRIHDASAESDAGSPPNLKRFREDSSFAGSERMDMDLLAVEMHRDLIYHSSPIATRSSSSKISAGVEASFAAEEEALLDFEVHGKKQLMSQFLEDLEKSGGFCDSNELEDSLRELQAMKAISLL